MALENKQVNLLTPLSTKLMDSTKLLSLRQQANLFHH